MKQGSDLLAAPLPAADGPLRRPPLYTPGLSDGLGDRLLTFDDATATSLEILRFKREFSDSPGFEAALRKRVGEIGHLRHASVATSRSVDKPAVGGGFSLISTHVAGRRLSEIVQDARGPAFAFELIRQIAPALAALQQHGAGFAHGALTPSRVVVTREGRLVVVECALGAAIQVLQLPAARLRSEIGIAVLDGDGPPRIDARLDVVQLGFVALSLLVGQRLDPADYPVKIPALLDECCRIYGPAAARLRAWIERALQFSGRKFGSAHEAFEAFKELREETASVEEPLTAPTLAGEADHGPSVAVLEPPSHVEPEYFALPAEELKSVAQPMVQAASRSPKSKGFLGSRKIQIAVAALAVIAAGEGLFIAGFFTTQSRPVANPTVPPPPATSTVDASASANPQRPATPDIRGAALTPGLVATDPNSSVGKPEGDTAPPDKPATPVGKFGGIKISSAIELQVYEAGTLVGSTAGPLAVGDGPHVLDFVNEALAFRARETVTVKPGQMTPVTIAIPKGKLSINAVPWAEVWIDGKAAGETPLANLSIPIGFHEIVLKHPQLGEQRQMAVVKADGLTRVSATFQQPGGDR
jgi:PEGA domain-containing protein